MATQNTVNIGINVSDNGTAKKVVKNFQEIEAAATKAQRAVQPVKSTLTPGGTSGSRRASEPTGTQSLLSGQEYNRGRGSMGATGASARDFANQAQGLGGLVRLYATYAANVFAVGAAFRALSNAMDTANLVKGLDQLGASSGTALGTLSKRLVEATDGAISLREAMESTAKASSSGMSSDNILRMGKVAKQAAQALGIDMGDAVSRLTRGITKLEPELLDELGIFTKVGTATEAYAKSVGKSTSAITDFEKRMAFANAVLAEGERKFSAIDLETNPYTKLLATLRDVAQVGLEVTNKVLGPIISFLAQNPTALAAAVAALGVSLVKQALPALGQFKAGLSAAAEEASKMSVKKAQDAESAKMQIKQANLSNLEDIANAELIAVNRAEDGMQKLRDKGFKKTSAAYRLLSADVADFSKENAAVIQKDTALALTAAKRLETQAKTLKDTGADQAKVDSLLARAQAQRDVVTSVTNSIKAEKALDAATNSSTKATITQRLTLKAAEKAQANSIKQNIIANAAYNGSLIGLTGAYALMKEEIKESGLQLTKFQKGMLGVRAGLAIVGGAIGTAVGAISGFLGVIGLVTAAVAFLSSFFSANGKQMSAFSSAVDSTDESLLNLSRTLDDISRKSFGDQFNSQSLLASATAINEISSSVSSLVSRTLDADKAANGFDRFIDGFKTLWGGDLRSQFAKSISGTVFGTLDKLSDSPEAQKAKASIASILEVDTNSSREDWQSAFKAIADNEPKLRLVERAMKDLGLQTGITASKAQEFDTALKVSQDAYKTFTNQFKSSDPLSQLAESLIASGTKTAEAVKTPEEAIARLASVVGDVNKIALFDEADQKNLIKYGDSITQTNQNLERNKLSVKSSKDEIKKLTKELENLRTVTGEYGQEEIASDEQMAGNKAFDAAKKQLDARKAQLSKEQALLANSQLEIATLTARFPSLAAGQLVKGADMLSASISASLAKGSTAFSEAVLASVGDLPGIAKQREAMELRKLESEAKLIKTQVDLARATLLNSAELRRVKAVEDVSAAQSSILEARGTRDPAAEKRLKDAKDTLAELDKTIAVINVDPSQAISAIKTIQSEIKAGNKTIQQDAVGLFGFINNLAGLSLQAQNNETARKAALYKGIVDGVKEEYKEANKTLALEKESNSLVLANYALQKARNGSLSESEAIAAQEARSQAITLERNQKLLTIGEKLAVLSQAQASKATALSDETFEKERGLLLDQVGNTVREAGSKITESELATSKEVYTEQQRLVAVENKLLAIKKSGSDAVKSASDKIRDLNAQTAKEIGKYTPEYQAQQDALLQIAKVRGEAERAEEELTSAFIIRSYALQAEAKQKLKDGASKASIDETLADLTAEAEAYGKRVVAVNSARDAEINAITKIEEARKNQSSFDATIESVKALDSVWGNFGSTLADTVSVFTKLAKSQEQYANTLSDLEFERDATTNTKEKLDLEKKIDKTRKASVRDEISGYAKTAGAAKGLFKEKTFAYKALAATEKVLHVTRLAMDIKEMISDTAKTGTSVGNSAMRTGASIIEAGVDGVKAVVKAISSLPFPLNIAAGAATAAVVAGLLSQIGGKSPSVGGGGGFVPTSEQRQETQGTAMGYDSQGNKVQVRRGVFGDTEAKSESIANSLEIIRDNSVDGLAYDNKMLRALENLNEALNSAAKGLFGVKGLRAGSLSGVTEGTNTGGGLLGIGGLFSSSTSKSIIDSGIQLKGTFYDLAKGVRGTINTFETISTTVKKSGFFGIGGSTSTNVATNFKDLAGLDPKAFQALSNTFNYAADLLYYTAETAGVAANNVTQALKSISVDEMASLRGLTGEDFTKELSAVISSVLDDASLAIFASFEKYANFGEGMLETVVRVVDTNKKIDQALKNMGLTFDVSKDYTETIDGVTKRFGITIKTWSRTIGVTSQDITEALAKSAGGLDSFLEQAQYFRENFLTEVEQLAPIQAAVGTELSRLASLGYTSADGLVDTREEFKLLIQSLDLGTVAGRETYQALMNVQEGFIAVTESAQKESEERTKLEEELLKLGASKEALRQMELDALFEGNRQLQQEIWLKEDQMSAAKALQTSLQNVTKTIRSQITSLQDYKIALLGGANSTLTATQQYSNAKTEIEKLVSTIQKTATTPEEIDARNQALSKLSSASDKFLGKSRELFASGAQYSADFNSIMGIINTVSGGLESQLTDAEKQLGALESANTYLESISDASKTTAQLLETYLSLGGTSLSTPGFAVGTNFVPNDMVAKIHRGERIIPAADNLELMSAVSNRNRTNEVLVSEIKKLNQKIDSLERTVAEGAVINAEATNRNTQQVAQAVVDSSGKTIQANRLQAKAGIK